MIAIGIMISLYFTVSTIIIISSIATTLIAVRQAAPPEHRLAAGGVRERPRHK